MFEKPLISICIPTYNQTWFLTKTLDSIVQQKFKDFEVIISDDSTNDEVQLLISKYKDLFKIVYFRNSPSLGSPANWNKAMDLANGDLIKFMHHDDWFETQDSLGKFANVFFQNEQVNFVFCNSKILNVATNTFSYNVPDDSFIEQIKYQPKILFNHNLIGAPSAVMFRKTNLRFDENIKFVVDVDFYISYLVEHKHFIYINEALITNTSQHDGQVTAQSMNTKTQIGEHVYLYDKLFGRKIPNLNLSVFFIFLFRQYPIQNIKDILKFNKPIPRPNWYFSLLLFIAKSSLIFKKVNRRS